MRECAEPGAEPLRHQRSAGANIPEVSPVVARQIKRRRQTQFLKGPISLTWLQAAARLPGRALHLGLLIWYRAGLENRHTVRIPAQLLKSFGLDRDAKRRGLLALESAGLVSVTRRRGRPADITLLANRPSENTVRPNDMDIDGENPGEVDAR